MKRIWVFVVLLLAPRVVRVLYPELWIEDESYLNLAFVMSEGARPYLDFPLQHFPLLEAVLAGVFRLFGSSIRTAEICTQVAVFAVSVLVYRMGRALRDPRCGAAAAIVFAWSSLVFRYHVFERELFLLVPLLVAAELAVAWTGREPSFQIAAGRPLRPTRGRRWGSAAAHCLIRGPLDPRWPRRLPRLAHARRAGLRPLATFGLGLLLAVLMSIAIACKQTAWSSLVALAIYLWWIERRGDALVLAGGTIALIAVLSAFLFAWAGDRFFVQVILFGWRHAVTPFFRIRLDELVASMDIPLALGAGGVLSVMLARRVREWRLPLLNLAIGFVVLVVLKPVYWAHNGIELLPWVSLFGGFLLTDVIELFMSRQSGQRSTRTEKGARRDRRRTAPRARPRPAIRPILVLLPAATSVGLLLTVVPMRNLNWDAGAGSAYGFGYRDRTEIAELGAFVRQRAAPATRVAVPSIIAFAANRRELVPYPELAGRMQELETLVAALGRLRALLSGPETRTFWEEIEASRAQWMPRMLEAIKAGQVPVVINSSEDDLFPIPLIAVPESTLVAAGYSVGKSTPHYRAWVRSP